MPGIIQHNEIVIVFVIAIAMVKNHDKHDLC